MEPLIFFFLQRFNLVFYSADANVLGEQEAVGKMSLTAADTKNQSRFCWVDGSAHSTHYNSCYSVGATPE